MQCLVASTVHFRQEGIIVAARLIAQYIQTNTYVGTGFGSRKDRIPPELNSCWQFVPVIFTGLGVWGVDLVMNSRWDGMPEILYDDF
eukprot:4655437-Amphidinium_carterae.1